MEKRMGKMRNNFSENKTVMPQLNSRRFGVCDNLTGILCILALVVIILSIFTVSPSRGSKKNSELPVISLRGENFSLKDIFNKIRDKTGYKVIFAFDEKSEHTRITVRWNNQPLIQGMREIAKKTGLKNFVIVTDNEKRTLKIFNFDYGPWPQTEPVTNSDDTGLTLQELAALHERQRREVEEMGNNPDELVIPPKGDHPGVTRQELQALHERQKNEIARKANDPDAIAIPASTDHPALTNRQLQTAHIQQKNKIMEIIVNPNGMDVPMAIDNAGLAQQKLQALHERQKREIQLNANNPDAIAIPASDGLPPMTKRELKVLHEQQKRKLKGVLTK